MSEITKCPKCSGELEAGFLMTTGTRLWWDTRTHRFLADGEQITPNPIWKFSVQNLEALRCKKCKLIMFEYGKEAENLIR